MEEERRCPPEFLYEALNKHFNESKEWLRCAEYQATLIPGNEDFIGFSRCGKPPEDSCADGKIFKRYGLKFHISLPEFNRDMYERGWEILVKAFLYFKVENFKVIRSHCKMSDDAGQEGKDVTIYADEQNRSAEQWKIVLEDITNKLVTAKVDPGYRALGTEKKPEQPVSGSNYVTYRYYDEWTKKSVWPQRDPCQKINVMCQIPQPDIPPFNRQKIQETVVVLTKKM